MAQTTGAPFVRLKYRPEPVEPELKNPVPHVAHLSVRKKEKPPTEDDLENLKAEFRYKPPTFWPAFTQTKRVETVVYSSEIELRKKQAPTMNDRVQLELDWARKKLKEAKENARREEEKKKWEDKILKEEELLMQVRAGKIENEIKDGNDDYEEENIEESTEDDVVQKTRADLEDEAEMAERLLKLKEEKFIRQRVSKKAHIRMKPWPLWRLAMKISMGFTSAKSDAMSEILPWLYLGDGKSAEDQFKLSKLSITHIVNVTEEVKNRHPHQFVYQQLSVKDNEKADIGAKFEKGVEFLRRVEKNKGKAYVHCSAGSSRAPSIVIAFLICAKKVTLLGKTQF